MDFLKVDQMDLRQAARMEIVAADVMDLWMVSNLEIVLVGHQVFHLVGTKAAWWEVLMVVQLAQWADSKVVNLAIQQVEKQDNLRD